MTNLAKLTNFTWSFFQSSLFLSQLVPFFNYFFSLFQYVKDQSVICFKCLTVTLFLIYLARMRIRDNYSLILRYKLGFSNRFSIAQNIVFS